MNNLATSRPEELRPPATANRAIDPKDIEMRLAHAEDVANAALNASFAIARQLVIRGVIRVDGINAITAPAAAGVDGVSEMSKELRSQIRAVHSELLGLLPRDY